MIPAGPGLLVRHGRGALVLLAISLTVALALKSGEAGAQSPADQSSAYTALRQDVQSCNLYAPQFGADTALLFNDTSRSARVSTEVRVMGGGARYIRNHSIGANSERQLTGPALGLPTEFAGGSFKASLPQATPTPVRAATATPVATAIVEPTAIPEPEEDGNLGRWLELAKIELSMPVAIDPLTEAETWAMVAAAISTPTPAASCRLAAVISRDNPRGDGWAAEAITDDDVGADAFLPVVHHADAGFNTELIIQNVGARDASLTLSFRSDRGPEDEIRGTIRSASSVVIDMRSMPKGLNSVVIGGSGDARLIAGAYHTGPLGMAASNFGVPRGASRVALPLLFRAAGHENAYSSEVRVMSVASGAVEPRITFRDRDSGERIGPIRAIAPDGSPKVLREGKGHTWYLTEISELRDGRIYSAEVDGEAGGAVVAVVEHVNTRRGTLAAYSGVPITGDLPRVLTAPLVVKNSEGPNSSIQVQNLTGNNNPVTIRFFSMSGRRVVTETISLRPRDSATVYLPATSLPDGFLGRAEIVGSGAIGAVVHTVRYRGADVALTPTTQIPTPGSPTSTPTPLPGSSIATATATTTPTASPTPVQAVEVGRLADDTAPLADATWPDEAADLALNSSSDEEEDDDQEEEDDQEGADEEEDNDEEEEGE